MNDNLKFEQDIVDELKNGRKISAIKLLRTSRGIGLKEAKDLVDTYCRENKIVAPPSEGKSGSGMFFLFILIAGLGYSLYVSVK